MHKIPLSELEIQGLKAYGLPVGKSSAMADCFRLGMAWAHKAAAINPAPKYLLGGTRFKLLVNPGGGYHGFNNYPELNGRWVALVAAEDNRHMLPENCRVRQQSEGIHFSRMSCAVCGQGAPRHIDCGNALAEQDDSLQNLRELAADTAHALLLQLTALQEQGVDTTEFLDGIQPK